MKGAYELTVQNKRIHYQFTIKRNITVIRGDSATGKTENDDYGKNFNAFFHNSFFYRFLQEKRLKIRKK